MMPHVASKSLVVRMTGLRPEQCRWQVSMWAQMFFLLFLKAKPFLKKWVLALFLINTCTHKPEWRHFLLGFNGKLESEPLHLKQVVFPQLMTCSRTTSSNKNAVHLRTMRKSRVSFQTFFFPDIYLLFIQILFCFSHSAVTTSLWVTVLLLLF